MTVGHGGTVEGAAPTRRGNAAMATMGTARKRNAAMAAGPRRGILHGSDVSCATSTPLHNTTPSARITAIANATRAPADTFHGCSEKWSASTDVAETALPSTTS